MNWNFETDNYIIRLPVSDQDGDALYSLLSQQTVVDHIPRMAMTLEEQATDELRRIAMRFESREAAFWLIERKIDGQLLARIGVQHINWMMLNTQMQWELSPECDLVVLTEVIPAILNVLKDDLQLRRVEMRVRAGNVEQKQHLEALRFEHEGSLPSQFEYNGEDVNLDIYSVILD
ncbi:MAG: ribosomal-protein-alanine N-acetyltransferase [Thalassolituus sp.]|mgnify:FL=1|jgi:RimJ/RimL family protein N-acetyltransferase